MCRAPESSPSLLGQGSGNRGVGRPRASEACARNSGIRTCTYTLDYVMIAS